MRLALAIALIVTLAGCSSLRNGNGLIGDKASCPSYPVQTTPNVIEYRDVEGDGCP